MARGRALGFILAAAFLSICLAPSCACGADEDDFSMFVTVDETKVSIESGNLTVAVTRDWPRMVFWHTVDPFSPTFDIGFPRLYLFNDTDGDGRYCRSEIGYTVYLDSNHVEWNLSSISVESMPGLGEYVEFSMSANVDAYNSTLDAPPSVEHWANVTFWYRLAENDTSYQNPAGQHQVVGKTEVLVNMSVAVTNRTEYGYLAVERLLQGGGTTTMFQVLEDGPGTDITVVVSGREDETVKGENYTRLLNGTDSPTQSIRLAKEDGTVQAFYHWGSVAGDLSAADLGIPVNSSCYTTGTGLILHSALPMSNGTISFTLDSSLGIVESGFVGRMSDWLREHSLSLVMVVAGVAAVLLATSYVVVVRRRRMEGERAPEKKDERGP